MTNPIRRSQRPLVLGLLGGVAAGKSTVAGLLAARGFAVLDADREARQVMADPEIQRAVTARFGGDLFPGGQLDRAALAAIVFRDPAARAALEAITHPAIRRALEAGLEHALATGHPAVLDVPLLLEGGLIARCDACWFVAASPQTRQARARARGWDDGELARREANQADLDVKRSRCSHTICTDGSLEDVGQQVAAALAQTLARQRG